MHIYDNKWKYLANSLNGNKKQENKHNNKEVLEDKISGHKHCRVCQKSNYKFASSISYKQVKTSFQAYHRSIKKQIEWQEEEEEVYQQYQLHHHKLNRQKTTRLETSVTVNDRYSTSLITSHQSSLSPRLLSPVYLCT